MKIALCTTTIHVPHALKLMRKCSDDVRFFVAGDRKTPKEVFDFVSGIDNAMLHYYHGDGGWKCSEAIGFDTLARRNIAFLEALAWGADVIYSWDDDNIPVDENHFRHLYDRWMHPGAGWYLDERKTIASKFFNGVRVTGHARPHPITPGAGAYDRWFDPGSLLIPAVRHRGYPRNIPCRWRADSIIDVKIGVAAGLVIGDPDIDSTTRMELKPDIGQVHLLGQTGVVVDPNTWTVFNSQNTAVTRELIPAWFMMPGVGRHDDIYASLIVQRVARERNLHVHFGPPFTYQQRNEHNLITDLRAEIDGMENVTKLAELLDSIVLPAKSVIEDTRIIYQTLCHCSFIPEASARAGLVWLEDCESVL